MKTFEFENTDLNEAIEKFVNEVRISSLREVLDELFKGWVSSEFCEETDIDCRKEYSWRTKKLDELLRMIEPIEMEQEAKIKANAKRRAA